MNPTRVETIRHELLARPPEDPEYATLAVDRLLALASELGASDLHLRPAASGFEARWRIDGVLQPAVVLPAIVGPRVVARLKVLADLLTYKTEIPQEGRIRGAPGSLEMRVSTLPTLHGEKAVVRLFATTGRYLHVEDLGFPSAIASALPRLLGATSGAILFTGPAGSGKTTTIYACLREIVRATEGRRSLATLEDPIEVAVEGVAQTQVNPAAGLSMEVGLRALLRQDPEVIAVGEIRDRGTAEVAFQASLTGHLVLSTFHAGSAAAAVGRLGDMGVEPYLLRSGLLAVVAQRLARRLCSCARPGENPEAALGLPLSRFQVPQGCPDCQGTGYKGRIVLAEILTTDPDPIARAILDRVDVARLESAAIASGMTSQWVRAIEAVESGITSPAEIRRVLGIESAATPRGNSDDLP